MFARTPAPPYCRTLLPVEPMSPLYIHCVPRSLDETPILPSECCAPHVVRRATTNGAILTGPACVSIWNGDDNSLREANQQQTYNNGRLSGRKIYSKPTSLAFLVFVLIYVPCIAVIAAIRKETGKWKWALFNITYATSLAWIIAFIVSKIAPFFI